MSNTRHKFFINILTQEFPTFFGHKESIFLNTAAGKYRGSPGPSLHHVKKFPSKLCRELNFVRTHAQKERGD